MRRFILALTVLLFCGQAKVVHAEQHKLRVLTSFLPVYSLTANVAGDLAEVENLLPPNADPHDFQFSPREMKKLKSADILVVNGLGLEAWLDRVIKSPERPKTVVELAAGLKSELIFGIHPLSSEAASAENKADSTIPNPHIWLDPQFAAHAVTNILEALQKADPINAQGYARNAREFLSRLEKLDEEMRSGLAPLKDKPIVTFHDAFPYFARRYGLKVVGVIEKVPDVQPSPRYLTTLGNVIRREKVKAIFTDRQSSPKLPEQIGRDYDVPVGQLDTLETGEIKPDAYEQGMRSNLLVLKKFLK
ncbi:MAG: Periplasmic solute binding protein [Pedosphaera sp.]|nr:Periplasmic solute binding protein [Pedosphaera sp.]